MRLIPLLPFAAFVILGLFGHWSKERAHLVAVPAVVVSLILSILAFLQVAGGHHTSMPLYTWLTSGDLRIGLGFSIDRLTAVMLVLVTTVSSLVHVYTIGYMHGEKGYARFLAYIALFTFSMLMLVMALRAEMSCIRGTSREHFSSHMPQPEQEVIQWLSSTSIAMGERSSRALPPSPNRPLSSALYSGEDFMH